MESPLKDQVEAILTPLEVISRLNAFDHIWTSDVFKMFESKFFEHLNT